MNSPPDENDIYDIRDEHDSQHVAELEAMSTPQSPFAALQELQEEQREGYTQETITLTAMNTTENQNDPYAHLKAEHAAGRQIQISNRYNDCFSDCDKGEEVWTDCEPQWASNRKYRIAPKTAPAGKLTDGDLANAAAESCLKYMTAEARIECDHASESFAKHQPARTAFARAVREAVEKEQAEEITQLHERTHELNEEIARLTAELERYTKEYGALIVEHSKLQAELAKANAELERLRPRLMSTPPTAADISNDGRVLLLGDGNSTHLSTITDWNEIHSSWRRWLPLKLAAYGIQTAEEVEQERFEKKCAQFDVSFTRDSTGKYGDSRTLVLFEVWMLARAAKEGEK